MKFKKIHFLLYNNYKKYEMKELNMNTKYYCKLNEIFFYYLFINNMIVFVIIFNSFLILNF